MSIKAVFQWIYCMDFHDVLILLAIFTVLFCIAQVKFRKHRFWKPILFVVLISWASIVIGQTIIGRTLETTLEPVWQPFQSYIDALKDGGQKELLRSNFMNVVLFYPAGLLLASLLPERWCSWQKLLVVLMLFTGFSFAIEFSQYHYNLGLAQTDDVIHNVLGALIGAAVIFIIPAVSKKRWCRNSHR